MAKRHYKENHTAVGKLAKAYALKGEVKAQVLSFDFFRFQTLFEEQTEILLYNPLNAEERVVVIDKAYPKNDIWHLHFEGINSPEEISKHTNWEVLVPDEARSELPEGMFYFSDLKGLKAIDFDGNELPATVVEARENASNDIIIFKYKGNELIAPWIDDCIGEIDLEKNTIELNLGFLGEVYEI